MFAQLSVWICESEIIQYVLFVLFWLTSYYFYFLLIYFILFYFILSYFLLFTLTLPLFLFLSDASNYIPLYVAATTLPKSWTSGAMHVRTYLQFLFTVYFFITHKITIFFRYMCMKLRNNFYASIAVIYYLHLFDNFYVKLNKLSSAYFIFNYF